MCGLRRPTFPARWIAPVERVIPDISIEVQIVLIPDGVSLQGLSVLTRFFVGVGKISRRDKSIRSTSALRRPRFPKNFRRSTFRPARRARCRRVSQGGGDAHDDTLVCAAPRKARQGKLRSSNPAFGTRADLLRCRNKSHRSFARHAEHPVLMG